MELLTQLIAVSPEPALTTLVRRTCAETLSLPALMTEGEPLDNPDLALFADQFSIDVSGVSAEQRAGFMAAFGANAFQVAAVTYIADFVPRMRAGFAALGLPPVVDPDGWDHDTDPTDLLLNRFASTVGALRALDPVMSEVVRLRGAAAHNCRLCKSLREGTALDAGGSESMYSEIELYESSTLLDERHKAALRYVDALVWSPSAIPAEVAAGVRSHFSDAEATEITLDVMRNGINKIAVALGGDAPRVAEGTERYLLGADGQPVFS
ncbi:carboxymuconolactone decarboxylase family protein [Mycobacterium sp. CBMA293]|uniref:carboxymuconolactone decarboxylase family protein n=1 Tax=unclassified Mycolicibacterium TaxID=2636767 RepID=UPI0012DE515B|nr:MULTISPECIES: carboxymuconolactone decarboxylase family protein [unclassified Mycolicibacterium]MUL45667.1 carboxymuconolactone decarboxylase family protein [Mycolicibacterium sp. CBMA 360]MUL60337.1 carboxymuconolactone decarboxylase family protein [Mycolicibacterium sp. CBMA 335]MUL71451.1 carboxymuconolactone decarboxylase family protein [Mycolicibacterium sp. CBMA 311]MUL73124.1 carboxymuconolactone decarboxylase family protein [Mycolicibacterium sp. CBMA 311]MUL97067.1 carboxymuconolac